MLYESIKIQQVLVLSFVFTHVVAAIFIDLCYNYSVGQYQFLTSSMQYYKFRMVFGISQYLNKQNCIVGNFHITIKPKMSLVLTCSRPDMGQEFSSNEWSDS